MIVTRLSLESLAASGDSYLVTLLYTYDKLDTTR